MTDDQITAALDQLAAHREQITRLDAREATHYATLTGLLAGLTARTGPGPAPDDPERLPARPRPVLVAAQPGRPAASRSPGCAPGWTRSTGPATATWPPPSAPAGPPTTCACTAWTSPAGLWSVLYLQPGRDPALLSAQAEYQARILPALAAQLTTETTRCGHTRPPEHAMTDNLTLRQALAYARRGWPVFPCQPGQKTPATAHGFRDATTDPEQITDWFTRHPDRNLAIATGAPGPDVLDVDQHGPAGNGYAALGRLRRAGLLDGAAAYVRTPSGGLHAYFTGTAQRSGHLPALPPGLPAPPAATSWPRPPRSTATPTSSSRPPAATAAWTGTPSPGSCNPARQHQRPEPARPRTVTWATWPAGSPPSREGNRNAGLFWAANRALETDPAADLSPLAAAARQAGLRRRRRSPGPWTPPAAPARPAPNRPTTRPRR